MRVECNERARHLGDLAQIVQGRALRSGGPRLGRLLGQRLDEDQVARLDDVRRIARERTERAVVAQRARPFHLGERDSPGLAVA